MKTWTKEEALQTLKELSEETDSLKSLKPFSTVHTLWLTKCNNTLEEIFGRASLYYASFAALTWRPISGTPISTLEHGSYEAATNAIFRKALLRDLDMAKGLLLGAIDHLNKRELSDVHNAKDTGNEASLVLKVLNLAEKKLREVIRDRPEKEKQVQDAFDSLLVGADVPYGREVDSIEYSSKTYIPYFSLLELNLAVEIKLCSREGREKELHAEINDDILAYKTKYQNLIFIVYDLGFIREIDRFCGSFEKYENVTVRVIKH
ncbi:hypothetical protein ACFLYF_00585 [Chloroflexota bacterium]